MQENITQKPIIFLIRIFKLTIDVLKKAMIVYLNHLKNKQANWHEKIYVFNFKSIVFFELINASCADQTVDAVVNVANDGF